MRILISCKSVTLRKEWSSIEIVHKLERSTVLPSYIFYSPILKNKLKNNMNIYLKRTVKKEDRFNINLNNVPLSWKWVSLVKAVGLKALNFGRSSYFSL